MRKHSPSINGQSVLEFALVLPLLLLLTFGVIEFGFFVYNQQIITNAAREGARAGIVATQPRVCDTIVRSGGNSSIEWVVQQYCSTYLITFGTQNTPSVTVAGYAPNAGFCTQSNGDCPVQLQVSSSSRILLGLDPNTTMQAVAAMKYE